MLSLCIFENNQTIAIGRP